MSSNHTQTWLRNTIRAWLLGVTAILLACLPLVHTSATGSDFNLQVSPSPLVVSLTPGQTQTATLTVRNFSTHSETLQPGLSGLQVDANTQKVTLVPAIPADMSSWLHFSPSSLTVAPGANAQLTVSFATPQNVGFSYSVGITLTSTAATQQSSTGAAIKPEVVVFCLININRPDAKSQLSIENFAGDKSRYSFLPASFTVRIKNGGNVINQPAGTIFIQRSFNDAKPIATLPLNGAGGYVLPGTSRSFTSTWSTGFPQYSTGADGKRHLSWNWKRVSDLRIGRYVAKAVLVYNDGHQDVPVVASFTFWVIPWWLLTLAVLVVVVLIMGLIAWGWLLFKGTKKVKGYAAHAHRKKP